MNTNCGEVRRSKYSFILKIFIVSFLLLIFFSIKKIYVTQGSFTIFIYLSIYLCGFIISWLALFWHPTNQINLVLIILSIFFSLYLSEVLLCVVPSLINSSDVRHQFDDKRSVLSVLEDMQKAGVESYPYGSVFDLYQYRATEWNVFPLGNVAKKKFIVCNEGGVWVDFDTDEYGFNNPYGLQSAVPTPTVVLIGDSFAEGECVPAGQDIGSLLRRRGVITVNLGRGGDGPLLELATFLEYAVPLRPKIVFWFYYEGNDLFGLSQEVTIQELLPYLTNDVYSQQLRKYQLVIDQQLLASIEKGIQIEKQRNSLTHRLFERLTLVNVRGALFKAFRFFSQPIQPDQRESNNGEEALINTSFLHILNKVQQQVSSWGGKLYFVYLPSEQRYTTIVDENTFHRQQVLSMVNQLSIPIFDFHLVLQERSGELAKYFSCFPKPQECHYTAMGYELLAEEIFGVLKK